MPWSAIAAFLLALAVALGAFGAHGLKSHLDVYLMGVWEKAVFYHFVHALGLLLIGIATRSDALDAKAANRISWLLLTGVVFFSGSLYTLALTRIYFLGAFTPLGGLAFIAAWVWLGAELLRSKA